MLKLIRSLVEGTPVEDRDEIAPALAAAALMFEVIWADHDITEGELRALSGHLERLFDLDGPTRDTLIAQARRLHDESVGVQQYTRALNDGMSGDEKISVVRALWRLAYADREAQPLEEHAIRRIADLLYVPHRAFIAAKLAAKADSGSD